MRLYLLLPERIIEVNTLTSHPAALAAAQKAATMRGGMLVRPDGSSPFTRRSTTK